MASTRVRRSLLIAPAHKENVLAKLAASAADVCILELEVADTVIEAVRRDDFYAFTHASSEERLRNYQKTLLDSF